MIKGFRLILMLLMLSVIQGCSSGKIVKSYEGAERPIDQIGLLIASENISVISINGEAVPRYMINSLETTYGLAPGMNKVVFIYESIWAKSKGKTKAEKVRSKELVVDIDTKAGEAYHFSFIKPSNVREAQKIARDMKVTIYDSNEAVAALSNVYNPESQARLPTANNQKGAVINEAKGSAVLSDKPVQVSTNMVNNVNKYKVSKIESLKAIWAEMTAKEKKEFLVWAFQE